jgi:ParB-like chromosome segregation protein Spo0J
MKRVGTTASGVDPLSFEVAMNSIPFHRFADLFPLLQGAELQELADDIKANGQREPIILLCVDGRNQILDGRNRWLACESVGVEPIIEDYIGPEDDESLLAFVISRNLRRRHLNESQRAMLAAKLKPMFEEAAKQRQQATRAAPGEKVGCNVGANLHPPRNIGKSNQKAAEALAVSPRSVATASKVLDKAAPEVVQAVEAGKASVSDAAAVVGKSQEVQQAAAKAVNDGEAKTLRAAAAKPPKNGQITSNPDLEEREAGDDSGAITLEILNEARSKANKVWKFSGDIIRLADKASPCNSPYRGRSIQIQETINVSCNKARSALKQIDNWLDTLAPLPAHEVAAASWSAPRPGESVGEVRAYDAINCLKLIPKNDPLRKRAFEIVKDWIEATCKT